MRKNLFFVILVLLTCATKTWGQALIVANVVETPFSAALKSNGPFVYDGIEKTGAYIDNTVVYRLEYGDHGYLVYGSNCSYYENPSYGSLTGAKGTNA